MASYSNSSYSNSFYDLTGVYFNSTNQSSSLVDLDKLDARYLIKSSGGTISNNLIESGSVDIQTSLTIPNIGNVENALDGKQDLIGDGDLSITKTDGLQTALAGKQPTITDGSLTISNTLSLLTTLSNLDTHITANTTNITTLNKNNLIYNSKEYPIKALSNWIERTLPSTGNWRKIVYAPELDLFVAIKTASGSSSKNIMVSSYGNEWVLSDFIFVGIRDIVWSSNLGIFVIVNFAGSGFATSTDGLIWVASESYFTNRTCITYSPELNLFISGGSNGEIVVSTDEGVNWVDIALSPNTQFAKQVVWSAELGIFVMVGYDAEGLIESKIVYSYDGFNWVNVNTSLMSINGIAWSPQLNLFVAVSDLGDNRIITSVDGVNWITGNISLNIWENVFWSDLGMFVAVATNGYISYSTDGFNWNQIRITTTGDLRTITWSNKLSLFVIIGNDILYTSSLKSREPTNDNIFDSEFNSINENGEWTFKSLTATTITGNNLIYGEDLIDVDDKITSIESALTELMNIPQVI